MNKHRLSTNAPRSGWLANRPVLLLAFLGLGAVLLGPERASAAGRAEHVVVLVWDGMRPDFIRPQYAPNLYALATNGVFFRRHHPVYISSTEVNGTALATGMHPGHSGVIANADYRPEINFFGSFATEGLEAVMRSDFLTQGKYLRTPTVAEILQDHGIPTVISGSKAVALLHDRTFRKNSEAEKESVTLFEGKTLPRSVTESLIKVNDDKAFPTNVVHPNKEQDAWTTRSLIRVLWKKKVPKYTLLWLSEPDKSQHEHGVGHATALAGIESSDKNLGEIVKALNERGVLDKTDIFVVSDHGFSTIQRGVDVVDILKKQKFTASKKFENPEPGDVLVIGLGGSAMLYVVDRVESVIRRLTEFLQTSDFAGPIFSRVPIEGTFPLETVQYSSTNNPPDLVVALRWTAERNEHGAPGMFLSVEGTKNKGSHASLSRFDMNNTLVASGPDFKKGLLNDTPSGNIDLAPTILWILGVKPPQPMDGRVLHEALATSKESTPTPVTRTIEAKRDLGFFQWRQYLKFTEVGHAIYFDEGNGEPMLRPPADPD